MTQKIIIIGGGFIGIILGYVLAKAGLSVEIIEKKSLPFPNNLQDGRVFAITAAGRNILEKFGIWPEISPHTGPVHKINITYRNSPCISFDHLPDQKPMAHMISSEVLLPILYKLAGTCENLTITDGTECTNMEFALTHTKLILDNASTKIASLVIIADGKFSKLRNQLPITQHKISYNQKAAVFIVQHEHHHDFTATEHFYPQGPFAILPLEDGYHSCVVWVEGTKTVNLLTNLSDEEFQAFAFQKFGEHLGKLSLASLRHYYEISALSLDHYYYKRAVLAGDCAHSIHPIAGQGLNLGIRDANLLSDLVIQAANLGLDIGAENLLAHYNQQRRLDTNAMLMATDLSDRFFSNNYLHVTKTFALLGFNCLPSLKNFFIQYALGYRSL